MKINSVLIWVIVVFVVCSCAKNAQIKPINAAAFLDNYILAKTGKDDHVTISLWKKNVSWPSYKKIQLMPVIINKGAKSGLKLTHEARYQLQDSLEFQMRTALKPNFMLVNSASESILHMELAITDATVSEELTTSFATIRPSAAALSGLTNLLAGSESYRGRANVTARITDSTTGDLLLVATDVSDEIRLFDDLASLWGDIQQFYNNWAKQLSYQLCQKQNRGFCEMPQEPPD